jgi:hypothetical protein
MLFDFFWEKEVAGLCKSETEKMGGKRVEWPKLAGRLFERGVNLVHRERLG